MTAQTQTTLSPFHEGEKMMQRRVGKSDEMEKVGRAVIRPFMPDQHREFFGKIPFLVLGSVDKDGWPWASILSGRPGFMQTPTDRRLDIHAHPVPGDPLEDALFTGAPIGTVGVELSTRRRNRMNASVAGVQDGYLSLDVVQSFGNCPQYIQTHDVRFVRAPSDPVNRPPITRFTTLSPDARKMISETTSFYVASVSDHGADASHRGGQPGFVKVDGDSLLIPDFAGNNLFNTLGNFLKNPKAGLLFPDFTTGDVLMLTGTTEVLDESHADLAGFQGITRGWRFHLDHGLVLHDALPFRADFLAFSPNSLLADTWPQVAARAEAEANRGAWRKLKVTDIKDESAVVRSFTFSPTDALPLLPFEAGQFLTLRVSPDGQTPVTRTYTVSSAPADAGYRISVKRESGGVVSNHLHDTLTIGDVVEVKAPRGAFWLDPASDRPAVLFAGGVGITPMISMVRHVMQQAVRTRHMRPLTLFHAAKDTTQRAFHKDLRAMASGSEGRFRYIATLGQLGAGDIKGISYDHKGRITRDLIRAVLLLDDYDFFLCGPASFMQAIYDDLRSLGVPDSRIFAESFGPAALTRQKDTSQTQDVPLEAEEAAISFKSSGLQTHWKPGHGTLLEAAEAQGLTPAFSCRSGTCGSCLTRKLAGDVTYRTTPQADRDPDNVLICCAVPAKGTDTVVLDL